MTKYRLPAGIISEAKDHVNMLGDFVAWMSNQDGLFTAMNGHSKEGSGGYGRWNAEEYALSSDKDGSNDSEFAVALFDAMRDISPFLPEGHVFGWNDGAFGIFECRIKIIVEPEPEKDRVSIETLDHLSRFMDMILPIAKEMRQIAGNEIIRLGPKIRDEDKFYLLSIYEIGNLKTHNGSGAAFIHQRLKGAIAHRINEKNRKG